MKDKQQFDIDVYFTIKYYAQGTHKVHNYPYIKYFDVDANGSTAG